MRLLLVGTDADTNGIRLLSERTFDSRGEALKHLRSLAPGAADEVLLVDIDAAAPVIFVSAETPAQSTTGPDSESSDSFAGVIEVDDDLTSALGEAAADVQPSIEPLEAVESPAAPLSEEPEEPASEAEADHVSAGAYPTPFVPEPAGWPWDAAQSADESAYADAEDPATAAPPRLEAVPQSREIPGVVPLDPVNIAVEFDPLEEPAVDDEGIVQAPPDPVGMHRPLVMGEYADESPSDRAEQPHTDALSRPSDAEIPAHPAADDPADAASAVVGIPVEPMGARDVEPASAAGPLEDPSEEPEADEPPTEPEMPELVSVATPFTGPEPADPTDIAEYTCDDCVYVNTCPKHHDSEPAQCGSFQWRIA